MRWRSSVVAWGCAGLFLAGCGSADPAPEPLTLPTAPAEADSGPGLPAAPDAAMPAAVVPPATDTNGFAVPSEGTAAQDYAALYDAFVAEPDYTGASSQDTVALSEQQTQNLANSLRTEVNTGSGVYDVVSLGWQDVSPQVPLRVAFTPVGDVSGSVELTDPEWVDVLTVGAGGVTSLIEDATYPSVTCDRTAVGPKPTVVTCTVDGPVPANAVLQLGIRQVASEVSQGVEAFRFTLNSGE